MDRAGSHFYSENVVKGRQRSARDRNRRTPIEPAISSRPHLRPDAGVSSGRTGSRILSVFPRDKKRLLVGSVCPQGQDDPDEDRSDRRSRSF